MNVEIHRTDAPKPTDQDRADEVEAAMIATQLHLQSDVNGKDPVPFLLLDHPTELAISMLYGRADDVADFKPPLPIKVLRVLNTNRELFKSIMVHWTVDHKQFALVGNTQQHTWDSDSKRYLLARWSRDPVPTLDKMMTLAKERWVRERGNALKGAIARATFCLSTLESKCDESFESGDGNAVNFSAW